MSHHARLTLVVFVVSIFICGGGDNPVGVVVRDGRTLVERRPETCVCVCISRPTTISLRRWNHATGDTKATSRSWSVLGCREAMDRRRGHRPADGRRRRSHVDPVFSFASLFPCAAVGCWRVIAVLCCSQLKKKIILHFRVSMTFISFRIVLLYYLSVVPRLVIHGICIVHRYSHICLLYTSPSPRDATLSRMPSSA